MAYKSYLEVDGLRVPMAVYVEARPNVRYSITAHKINVRIPRGMREGEFKELLEKLHVWVSDVFRRRPDLRRCFVTRSYRHGDTVQVGSRKYVLDIRPAPNKNHWGRLDGQTMYIKLVDISSAEERQRALKSLMYRLVAQDFLPEVTARVFELNDRYFGETVRKVSLRYTRSRWGSCSRTGNISLSTLLLFAPQEVMDQVIIHELAHLKEPNHSPAFWAWVKKAMPDYKEKAAWLRKHGPSLGF